MVTLLLIAYSFMAGMMAEWSHTKQKKLGFKTHLVITALGAGLIWPYMLWRISR